MRAPIPRGTKNFYSYLRDWTGSAAAAGSKAARIKNPAPRAESDLRADLRGTKKNLILCDVFLFGGKNIH